MINRKEIEKYFSNGDIIRSGGGRSFYEIKNISDRFIRIKPTKAKTLGRLTYEKLSVVINYIELINPNSIEESVGRVLAANDLRETQNECYLFGMAKEYLKQKVLPTALIQKDFEEAIENSKELTPLKRKNNIKNAPKKTDRNICNY